MPGLLNHAPSGTTAHDLAQQRTRIARVLLGSLAVLGLVAYVPSVWLSVQVGAWSIAVLDTVAYAAIVGSFVYPRSGYRGRAGVLIGVGYLLGLLLTLRFGPVSAGPLWLCAVPVLTAVLFDRRATVAVLLLTVAALAASMVLAHARPGIWSVAPPGLMGLLAVIATNLILLATGLALAVNTLVRGLRGSAESAEELAAELVAERLRLEDANERLQAEMTEHAAAEARLRQAEKLTALGTLAGGIAHNLNNLLTPLLMGVELLRSEQDADDELLDRMQDAAVGAREVVRQVLTFSRALPDARMPLDAAEAFGEAVALLRASLPPRVELQTRFAQELGAVSLAPADAHQIVLNLGSNAQQAMPEGGKLTVTLDVVHGVAPGLDPQREYLCLGVRDTGTGMDADTLTRAAEPFFTTKPAGQGTGLGLATIHGIVTAAGGALRLFSEPGLGTAVHVYLPRITDPVPDVAPPARARPAARRAHVLLVDDDAAVLAVAAAFLRRLGHEVTEKSSVGSALSWLSEHPGEADLLLTDLNMPAGGGVTLVREARALQPALRVVLMSGFLDEPHYARARAVGVRHILAKPFQMDEIGAAVTTALRSPAAGPEPIGGR